MLSTEGLPERFQEKVGGLVVRAKKLQAEGEERGSDLEGAEQRDQLRRIFGELLPPVIAGFVKLNATTAEGSELKGEAEFVEVLGEIEGRLAVFERRQEEREWRLFAEGREVLGGYLKATS